MVEWLDSPQSVFNFTFCMSRVFDLEIRSWGFLGEFDEMNVRIGKRMLKLRLWWRWLDFWTYFAASGAVVHNSGEEHLRRGESVSWVWNEHCNFDTPQSRKFYLVPLRLASYSYKILKIFILPLRGFNQFTFSFLPFS